MIVLKVGHSEGAFDSKTSPIREVVDHFLCVCGHPRYLHGKECAYEGYEFHNADPGEVEVLVQCYCKEFDLDMEYFPTNEEETGNDQ